ncbi:MAG: hypothetical protein ISR45_07810 [Rhodospirillales bacterium]|nr:hypothetical protein [Rhodospirillales bacterium]
MRLHHLPVLFTLMLAACSSMEIPYVTQPLETQLAPKVEIARIADVRVELVQGPALPMAKLLSNSVAAGLKDHGAISTLNPNEVSRFILNGRAEANWDDRRVPFVMLIFWTLTDLSGKKVGEYTQGVRGARWKWEYGDPRIIRAVGNGAAKPLVAMIIEEENESLPVLLLGTGILVEPIIGAPGDGNIALRKSIMVALRNVDVSITEDRRQASVTLSGQVGVQPMGNGFDKVLIVWRILTMDGFEVGRATQENTVPAGQLQGRWGSDADKIADAAVIGIERILGSSPDRRSPSIIDPGGEPPPTPDLDRIPGRAPPPPE